MSISFSQVEVVAHDTAIQKFWPLAATIFRDLDREKVTSRLSTKSQISYIEATANEKTVGFKLGYELSPEHYYSWLGGVDPEFRGRGIARELMSRQHEWAKDNGYGLIETRTSNLWKPMLILNLKSGFDVVDLSQNERGLKIHLQKQLRK
ncbi:MAG: GNAT family N-acetyltransferase [Pseudomonadota bacterium]